MLQYSVVSGNNSELVERRVMDLPGHRVMLWHISLLLLLCDLYEQFFSGLSLQWCRHHAVCALEPKYCFCP